MLQLRFSLPNVVLIQLLGVHPFHGPLRVQIIRGQFKLVGACQVVLEEVKVMMMLL